MQPGSEMQVSQACGASRSRIGLRSSHLSVFGSGASGAIRCNRLHAVETASQAGSWAAARCACRFASLRRCRRWDAPVAKGRVLDAQARDGRARIDQAGRATRLRVVVHPELRRTCMRAARCALRSSRRVFRGRPCGGPVGAARSRARARRDRVQGRVLAVFLAPRRQSGASRVGSGRSIQAITSSAKRSHSPIARRQARMRAAWSGPKR